MQKYVLRGDKDSTGYNSIEPVEFTIHARVRQDFRRPKLTKLESLGTLTFTADKTAGTLSTDVVNNKGIHSSRNWRNG